MRHGKRAPDISDILPSVRARGVLVPLLVRPNGTPESFEIVAGRRRYFAAKSLADERGEGEPLPAPSWRTARTPTRSKPRLSKTSLASTPTRSRNGKRSRG
ncbi:ParB N-terminal domain-containing protein [Mesorhizobium sp.]|nr:ParB N-terminal domain-containing protein [Mesorhizobium sp.]